MKEEEAKARALRTELFQSPSAQSHGQPISGAGVGLPQSDKGKEAAMDRPQNRYRDAGVQADLALPQLCINEVRMTQKVSRRYQSEPLSLSPSAALRGAYALERFAH